MPASSSGLLDRPADTTRRLKHDGRHVFQAHEVVTRGARQLACDRGDVLITALKECHALRVEVSSASEGCGHTAGNVSVQEDESNARGILVTVSLRIRCLKMLSP